MVIGGKLNDFMIRGAFLDRDGIVNFDKGYVFRKQDFSFYQDIFNLCHLLQEKGFRIFIITNQSGIGRGYYTIEAFQDLTDWMLDVFKDNNVLISKVYYCPHHPLEAKNGFKKDCQCRKPNPGMIFQAQKEYNLNLKECILIGDKESDIQAGINAGIRNNYLINNDKKPIKNITRCKIYKDLDDLLLYLTSFFIKRILFERRN